MPSERAADIAAAVPHAVRACQAVLGNRDDAEDVVGAAVEAALRAPDASVEHPRAWLVAVSRRRAVDLIRQRERERRYLTLWNARETQVQPEETDVHDVDEARWLRQQSLGLPRSTQAVLTALEAGHDIGQAAAHLGMTRRAAESHLLRARRRLYAAWLATLGVVSGFALRARRVVVLGPPALLAGISLLLAPVLSLVEPEREPPVPDTDRATVIDDVNGTRRPVTTATGGRSRATAAHLRPAGGHGSPSAREITSFSTPLAEGRLYEEDRGGSSDPVQGVLQCVQELEVRPGVHIGC